MLKNLYIKNFRMLRDLEIPKIGRVNLIIGKNNSGKSTVLEALRIYASKAHPMLLREIILGHDETYDAEKNITLDAIELNWSGLKNLFPGRTFPVSDEDSFSIQSDGKTLLQLEHALYTIKVEEDKDESGERVQKRSRVQIKKSEISDFLDPTREAIKVSIGETGRHAWIDIEEDIRRSRMSYSSTWRMFDESVTIKCSNVTTEFLSSENLAEFWGQVSVLPAYNSIVMNALKVIEPKVEGLAFVKSNDEDSRYARNQRLGIIKLSDMDFPVPLNSMGDGMSRILQLILSVFPAKDGILLIDEFENGLHYSVQEEVWKIIFKLATQLNIQVFATTHSWDCIESFSKVANEDDEDGILIKLSRSKLTSDIGKVKATIYSEDDLKSITASSLEVR